MNASIAYENDNEQQIKPCEGFTPPLLKDDVIDKDILT